MSPLCPLLLMATCLATFPDQGTSQPAEALVDPYTGQDQERIEAAGYRSIGDQPWADDHTTRDIVATLGEPVLWLETEHFRIGSTLEDYRVDRGDRVEAKKLQQELKRLRERLPDVPKKARNLDPWLRLHLYAMRAEDLYANIEQVLQLEKDAFPAGGLGPYLGMKGKFTILLTEKKSTLARYAGAYCGITNPGPVLHHFQRDGVQFLGFSAEFDAMSSDTTMHCMVTYCLTLNLLNGYQGFRTSMPAWVAVGLGHHQARSIDEQRNYFSAARTFGRDDKDVWDWEVRVRGRVKNDADPKFTEVTAWEDHTTLSFPDVMMAWARVDHLLQEEPEAFAELLAILKSPFPKGQAPQGEALQEYQIQAMQTVLGMETAEIDQ